jgi:UDP-N-acetyl-alpha-D-muramoyl-L-alanyl-L-glutamate epimerase
MTLSDLRKQYPRFIYDSYQTKLIPAGLKIIHNFQVAPDIEFHPTVTIEGVSSKQWEAIPQELRDEWVFHLGLAEIPSYWKATASPEIIIKAGYLSPKQIAWWHDLLIKGMGEYFYVNQIDFTSKNFVKWHVEAPKTKLKPNLQYPTIKTDFLVPIGGGKDSTLTLCFLDQKYANYDVFMLNPTKAMEQISKISKPKQIIVAKRIIDPALLALNKKGYLNGHTPFSAYLGFLSRFAGSIFGHRSVVISNERSSNEGNVLFRGVKINHQYSKTYEFEQKFEQYLKKYGLVSNQQQPAYFSILRPFYELQISKLFLDCPQFDEYTSAFRSCNRGQKTNSWCGECPKCLFAFASFYPFISEKKVISIFGQNLFNNESLLDESLALLGKTDAKPFECVGTHEESTAAFYLCIKKAKKTHNKLPALLQLVWDQVLIKEQNMEERSLKITQGWSKNHQLPAKVEALIREKQSKTLKQISNRQIIIFGLGREGLSTYRFLRSHFPTSKFILIDERPLAELIPLWTRLVKNNSHAQFTTSLTDLPQNDLRNSILFKTPGIPVSHPIVQKILDAGNKISSNTQLFFDLVKEHSSEESKHKIITIGVTGTKGKSTTASVIHHVLEKNKIKSYLGGNIGQPAIDAWLEWDKNQHQDQSFFVIELSSHQLAELKHSPDIAVVQDIVSEHLDYYDDFEQYYQAKTQIARFQTKKDTIILNKDSKTATKLSKLSGGKKIPFSLKDKGLLKIAKTTSLIGQHNIYNVMPSIIIARKLGVNDSQIKKAVKTFKSLPHRLEFVAEINGVKYYDDSISTVPEATIAALKTFAGKSIVLIAGGYERQQQYKNLAEEIIKCSVKSLSLLPPTGQRLLAEIEHLNPCNELRASIEEFSFMAEAVYYAAQKAKPGFIVLLSPGAASFNNFIDYVDRGNQFKEAVKRLRG